MENVLHQHPTTDINKDREEEIERLSKKMKYHSVFSQVKSIEHLKIFMRWHVFAVWDFMTLMKRLQHEFTHVSLPWVPAPFPMAARLLNEIVLGEESDERHGEGYASHFELYLDAMEEIGADTYQIRRFIDLVNANIPVNQALQIVEAPLAVQEFVNGTMDVALKGTVQEVLGSFLYGREDAIPEMFERFLNDWTVSEAESPTFVYYLRRHIELDGDSHGPAAKRLVQHSIQGNDNLAHMLFKSAECAINQRITLWDNLQLNILKGEQHVPS